MRMIIVGNSGSGKTWLSNNLSKLNGCQVIHLDHIFWEPGGFDKKRSPEVVAKMIDVSKNGVSWIAEGVFGELAERLIERAQYFVWLDIDWPICRERLLKSEWASRYYERKNTRSYEGHKKLLNNFHGEKIYINSEADAIKMVEKAQQIV